MACILESMRRHLPPAVVTRSELLVGCPSWSRRACQISQSSSSLLTGSDIGPPQLTPNGPGHSLFPRVDRLPSCRGFGLVAPDPIEQIGGGAGAPMAFTQPGGNLMGDGGRTGAAGPAGRLAGPGAWQCGSADRQGHAIGDGGGRPRRCPLRRRHVAPGARRAAVLPRPVGVLADC